MCVSSSFCWRANSKEHSLHATLSSWWVGAGGVCRWKEEALHCPGEREAPGGRNSSSPANMGWLWPCWKLWAKSWVSPLPMAPEDRMSGFLCFAQTRALQASEFAFLCARNVTSSFPISSGQLLSPTLSSVVLCSLHHGAYHCCLLPAPCPPPLDWGLLETSTRCPQGVKRHLKNAWIKVGMQRKAWTTGPQALMKWGYLQVSKPLPGIHEVKFFSL